MQVVLQGSLKQFPAAELLTFLCSRGQSGTLDVQEGSRRARILFQDDKILHAESVSTPGKESQEVVLDVFQWMDGTFALVDVAYVPENVAPAVLDLTAILEEARRRAEAAKSFPDGTFFKVVEDPSGQQVSLTADQFKILFRVGAGKTFRDLFAGLGIPAAELASRLRSLHELGLIAVIQEEPPPPEITAPHRKTSARKKTLVGSLTPDNAPDSVFPLLDSEQTIGRTSGNNIVVSDGSISSNHARILRTTEGFAVEDLKSRNGTFVNGERVAEKRALADGDLLRFGKVIMTFNIASEAKPSETTQPEVIVK